MKNFMAFRAIRNVVYTIAIVLPLQVGTNMAITKNIEDNTSNAIAVATASDKEEPVLRQSSVVLLDLKGEYCDTKCFLTQNIETVEFLTKTFGIDKNVIIDDLIKINSTEKYIETNIGRLTDSEGNLKEFNSFDRGLIEYLFYFAKNNPKLVDNSRTPYSGGADYVVDLIKYFTSIYDNVDYLTAVSIGAAESGYYKVKYMLNCNNVYGGMSSSGLIKHKNIEYGILSFIRLLSLNYYGKGVNTLEGIGKIYCPTTSESGAKIASPHWINLVNKAKQYYSGTEGTVTALQLLED